MSAQHQISWKRARAKRRRKNRWLGSDALAVRWRSTVDQREGRTAAQIGFTKTYKKPAAETGGYIPLPKLAATPATGRRIRVQVDRKYGDVQCACGAYRNAKVDTTVICICGISIDAY